MIYPRKSLHGSTFDAVLKGSLTDLMYVVSIWHMRASQALKAKRLNHARSLLQRFPHRPDAVTHMMQDSRTARSQHARPIVILNRLGA